MSSIQQERETRIKYQDIVYAVCLKLDSLLGRSAARGTGTVATKEAVLSALQEVSDSDIKARRQYGQLRTEFQSLSDNYSKLSQINRDNALKRTYKRSCECGACGNCKQRAYRAKRRKAGKDK